MKKKLTMLVAAALCAGSVIIAMPSEVNAMASCSQDIINAANAQINATTQEYVAAQAREAEALANLNKVKAASHTELELTTAANAYTAAQQSTRWYLDQVNNAKAYLKNITDRANLETAVEVAFEQGKNLAGMQDAKLAADSAQAVATGVLEQIKAKQNAIAGYQQVLATSPSVQSQIDALNAEIAALQADYTAKQAAADAKKAAYEATVANDNYDQYSKAMIDYWTSRDNARGHESGCKCSFCSWVRDSNK